MKKILVVPASMSAAINFARENSDRFELVGASSNHFEPAADEYSRCLYLPHVSESEFMPCLERLLVDHEINSIYCAHQVVWSVIAEWMTGRVDLELLNPAPIPAMLKPYRYAIVEAAALQKSSLLYDRNIALPATLALAALYRNFMDIPGECDRDKLLLFLTVMADTPPGDIVEIGSLWGKLGCAFVTVARWRS